jgi:hypothetical protein
MASSQADTQTICKKIQDQYSSCDVKSRATFTRYFPADIRPRYRMLYASSKFLTQVTSQTFVSSRGECYMPATSR